MPERRCVACGRRAPQRTLIRFAARGGMLVRDRDGLLAGRGAYACDAHCAELALQRRAFQRALRAPIQISADFVDLELRG